MDPVLSQEQRLQRLIEKLQSPSIQVAQGAYFTFVFAGGFVFLPLVLVTFAFSKVPGRNAGLVNFLASLVVFAFGIVLLPLTGQLYNPLPSRGLCFFQLGAIQGGLIATSVAAVTIVVHLAFNLPGREDTEPKLPRALRRMMAGLPCAAFVIYVLAQAEEAVSLGDRLGIERGALVCRFADGSPFFFKKGTLVVLSVALAIDLAATLYLFLRIKDPLKLVSVRAWREQLRDDTVHSSWLALLIRLALFEIICIAAVILVALDALAPNGTTHFLLVGFGGLVPFLVFLIFGTTTSLRRVWCDFVVRISKRSTPDPTGDNKV